MGDDEDADDAARVGGEDVDVRSLAVGAPRRVPAGLRINFRRARKQDDEANVDFVAMHSTSAPYDVELPPAHLDDRPSATWKARGADERSERAATLQLLRRINDGSPPRGRRATSPISTRPDASSSNWRGESARKRSKATPGSEEEKGTKRRRQSGS